MPLFISIHVFLLVNYLVDICVYSVRVVGVWGIRTTVNARSRCMHPSIFTLLVLFFVFTSSGLLMFIK